jgi:hypothetical protein
MHSAADFPVQVDLTHVQVDHVTEVQILAAGVVAAETVEVVLLSLNMYRHVIRELSPRLEMF